MVVQLSSVSESGNIDSKNQNKHAVIQKIKSIKKQKENWYFVIVLNIKEFTKKIKLSQTFFITPKWLLPSDPRFGWSTGWNICESSYYMYILTAKVWAYHLNSGADSLPHSNALILSHYAMENSEKSGSRAGHC